MVVITLSVCPSKLRGDLSKWVQEIDDGVYVGRLSARVREELWNRIESCMTANSRALMIYSHNNAQGYLIKTHGTRWKPIDVDGLIFMQHPLTDAENLRFNGTCKAKRKVAVIEHQDIPEVANKALPVTKTKKIDKKTTCGIQYINEEYFHFSDWYVVVDIETSGLDVDTCDVIEIAALEVKNGVVEKTFETLIKIENPLPELIVEMTGITDEMLQNHGVEACSAIVSLIEFIDEHPIVSFCAHFDFKFLFALCDKYSLPRFTVRVMDAWQMAQAASLCVENYKLSTLAEYFGIDCTHAHRALPDCVITMQLFDKLNKNLASNM